MTKTDKTTGDPRLAKTRNTVHGYRYAHLVAAWRVQGLTPEQIEAKVKQLKVAAQ